MSESAEHAAPEEAAADMSAEAIARALQSVIEQKDAELAALKDQALRALAETENTRRRSERELADMSKYAVTGFARDLVSVLENLQRAVDSIPAEMRESQPAVANLAVGVEMTLKELLGVFARHGIERLDPMGQKFDHNFHQAIAQVDAPDAESGTVVQVLQAGYKIHDRLLRPAMVGVAAGAAAKPVSTSA
ncbi:MAG: nucleotide exchange factor GrpE [Alphaproteobacteria bacterium]|nr:nucleotide exchange factor GrpE [Alphaproteobacteria bacterium]